MKRVLGFAVILAVFFLFNGCAGIYKDINPPVLHYYNSDVSDGIGFSYKYDVLTERGNMRYAKKERRKGVKLVAVKITNNYDTTLNIGRDIIFFSGNDQVTIINPYVVQSLIKQSAVGYLFYLLLTPLQFNTIDQNGRIMESYNVGLVMGPGITLINMFTAGNANARLGRELAKYNVMNRDIQSGETIYGLIGIMDTGFNPLSVKLRYPEDQAERDYFR